MLPCVVTIQLRQFWTSSMKNAIIRCFCDNRCLIELTQDQFTLIDPEDLERLNQWKWYAHWNPRTQSFYAIRNLPRAQGKQRAHRLHREVMGLKLKDSREVDHVNHDTLDNRKSNLCIVTRRQNLANLRNQSQYGVGVYYRVQGKSKPYQATVYICGKSHHVGYFLTPEQAQQARRQYLDSFVIDP